MPRPSKTTKPAPLGNPTGECEYGQDRYETENDVWEAAGLTKGPKVWPTFCLACRGWHLRTADQPIAFLPDHERAAREDALAETRAAHAAAAAAELAEAERLAAEAAGEDE